MSTLKEMEAQVLKVKERSRERLKIINQLTEENKELRIQNKFLVDRLAQIVMVATALKHRRTGS